MAHTASRTTPNLGSQPLRGADFERAHSSVVLGEDARDRRRGFTIVELLIVVVVIAILAAITIVAYNGITNRSKAAAASAAAEQAAKKVMTYAAVNSDQYPSTLSDAGVADGSATYQYRVDNTSSPKTFCLTATTQTVSYYVSSTSATPSSGVCAGHAATGQTLVTNLSRNPRATSYAFVPASPSWRNSRWFGNSGGAGTYSTVTGAVDGPVGVSTYARKTWTSAPAGYSNTSDTGFETGYTGTGAVPVTEGQPLTISCYLRPSVQRNLNIGVYQYTSSGASASTPRIYGPDFAGSPNVWTRVSLTYTPMAGVTYAQFTCDSNANAGNSPANWAIGSTLDGTALMVTEGPTLYGYADGQTAGWAWNGEPNNATSTS